MQSKISLKWLVVVLVAVGIIFFFVVIIVAKDFYANPISPIRNPMVQESRSTRSGLPIRLVIPEIDAAAAIEYVGLTPQGAMAVPAGPTSTAWFDLGPRPGEIGSAVIAGHEGWKDGIRAVFDDLYELRIGDKVYVEGGQNKIATFVVIGIRTYGQNGDASDVFDSKDGKAHLNLITCEGMWNAAQKSYSDRLVVFTDEK
jgi:LPXTG-site transpeptidase (sortase) family protein